ncbi:MULTISPECIES: MFS transporter [Streptomyces]|uniref:MFS transporter n=1 Tax=Streptomyces ramulosus TaxID=47762 RepID=A0ABW1FQ35_9ACTN
MSSPSTTTGRTGPGTALLAVVMPAVLVTVAASDMVNLMLPRIQADFGASEAELAWVVTGFLLVFSVGIPLYGRLSDRVALRRLFAFALLAYAAGNLICAIAPSLPVLVAGRIVTGAGGAGVPVLSVIAVTRLLPAERRGAGIGVASAGAGIGAAVGPALGGWLGQWLGWPSLFRLLCVAALVLLPAAWRVLPDERPVGEGRLDLPGGLLLGAGTGLALFGMTRAQVAGFGAPTAWGALLAGGVTLAFFGWRTGRVEQPFVPPALLRDRTYRTAVLVVVLAMAVNLGGLVFVPLVLVEVNGLTPGEGAFVMIPAGVAVALVSPLIGRLSGRVGARGPVLTGIALMGTSALALSAFTGGASALPAGAGILGIGLGFILVITTVIGAVASHLPAERTGAGIGILQGAQFLGAGAGPAVFGVLVAARRQSGAAALNPLFSGHHGAAYSDVFLAMAAVALLTLLLASRLRPAAASAPAPQTASPRASSPRRAGSR